MQGKHMPLKASEERAQRLKTRYEAMGACLNADALNGKVDFRKVRRLHYVAFKLMRAGGDPMEDLWKMTWRVSSGRFKRALGSGRAPKFE